MYTDLLVAGFKGYSDATTIQLKPLTVLCGTNGCGKTTLLQAILLLKQTLTGLRSPRTVLLNGDQVHLGGPVDVLSGRDENGVATIGVTFTSEHLPWVEMDHRFIRNAIIRALWDVDVDVYEEELELKLGLSFDAEPQGIGVQAEARTIVVSLQMDGKLVFRAEVDVVRRETELIRLCRVSVESHGVTGLPEKDEFDASIEMYGLEFEDVWELRRIDDEHLETGELLHSVEVDALGHMAAASDAEPRVRRVKAVDFLVKMLRAIRSGMRDGMTYVGPLRAMPQREYSRSNDVVGVGSGGEGAVQVYVSEVDRRFYEVKELDETGSAGVVDGRQWSLGEAMQYWFDVLSLGRLEPFETEYSTSVLMDGGRADLSNLSLADTGFGYSQVFPILLQGLRLPMAGTLLLEQPEIHLHPRMQMQVADFLLALANCERGVVVETHSDHIVNRIVRRVVEGAIDPSLVAVYFVSSGPEGPVVEEVEIDPLFGIRNWPLGFFDQYVDEQEAIVRASLRRRAHEGSN